MEVLAGKAEIELEAWHEGLYPLLGGQQSEHVVLLQSRALLAHEYVVHVYEDHAIEAQAQLAVRQIRERVEQQELVQPELEAAAEDDALDAVVPAVIL